MKKPFQITNRVRQKPFRKRTNNNDLAKFYIRAEEDDFHNQAIIITKLSLSQKFFNTRSHLIVKQFKDWYLYQESISFKPETLCEIHDRAHVLMGALKNNR